MRSKAPYEEGFLIILLVAAILGLLWLFSPFLEGLLFAMILATATYSLYLKLLPKLRQSEDLTAAVMSVGVFMTVIAPVSYLLLEVGLQVGSLVSVAQNWLSQQTPQSLSALNQNLVAVLPLPEGSQLELIKQLKTHSGDIIQFAQQAILFLVRGIFGSTTSFLTFVFLAVFALYFLPRWASYCIPLEGVVSLENYYDTMIMTRFSNLSTILLLSVLGIALMQGLVFTILAWMLGLPGLFIGLAIAITSFIPLVGAALIWVPLSLLLAAQGDYLSAGWVVFFGAVVNGFLIDNLLRPLMIRRIAQSLGDASEELAVANHTLITVLATFAGLIHFGMIGLFFGPVIAAMAITIFDVYAHKNSELLDRS